MFRNYGFATILLSGLIFLLVIGLACSDDSDEPSGPSGSTALTVSHFSDCKTGLAKLAEATAVEECIEWQYIDGALRFHHVNAGFNCCVTALMASFEKEGDAITITETENLESGGCNCLCLYDLDYQFSYLAAAQYTFTIAGPYMDTGTTQGPDLITFTIDLTAESSGSYCIERDHYPWQY